jgi:hypothetical protein
MAQVVGGWTSKQKALNSIPSMEKNKQTKKPLTLKAGKNSRGKRALEKQVTNLM